VESGQEALERAGGSLHGARPRCALPVAAVALSGSPPGPSGPPPAWAGECPSGQYLPLYEVRPIRLPTCATSPPIQLPAPRPCSWM
jgi:hypothetical protein